MEYDEAIALKNVLVSEQRLDDALERLLLSCGHDAAAKCVRYGIKGYWSLGPDPGRTRDSREGAIELLGDCVEEGHPAVIFVHTE